MADKQYVTVASFVIPDIQYEVRLEQFATAPYFRIKVYGGDPDAPAEWEWEGVIGHMSRRAAIDHFLATLGEWSDEILHESSEVANRLKAEGS